MANEEVEKEKRQLELQRQKRHAGGPGGRFVSTGEQARDFKGTMGRLLNLLKPQLPLIILTFFMTIAYTVASTYAPNKLADMVDVISEGYKARQAGTGGIDFSALRHTALIVGILYAVTVLCNLIQQFIMIDVAQNMVYDMRKQIDQKLKRLPIKYFDSHSRGDILSRVANDVENISMTLQMSLTQIISAVITLVSVLIFMFYRNALLTLISLLTVVLCFLMTKVIASKAKGYFTTQWASTGNLNGQIEEMYTGHTVVKLFGRQQAAMETFEKENEVLFQSSFKAAFISGVIQPAMTVINNLNYVAVCVLGGMWIVNGGPFGMLVTLGDVTAIITYSKQLMQPITQTASIASTIQSTVASAERVFELLDEEEAVEDQEPLTELQDPKVVSFEHVSFSYKPETKLIEDLNITVRPGEKVAIVGPTGAGKTTLVNLLMRFYEVDSGRIAIDGVDIRSIPRENLRSHIGMVLQDVWLFSGSIRDNIAYGYNAMTGREATEEEIVAAAKMAYVDHFVQTLPNGYDTVINDDATNISQGQKQLMTIARAFLSNPSILILDEATSSVDTRTEVLIQKAMQKLMEGRTSFVIAHRLSTIRDADLILVMNHGTIIEQGTHQQLLDQKGFYYDLYNSQFIGAAVEEEPAAQPGGGFPGGGFPGGGFPGGKGPGGKVPGGKGPGGKGPGGKGPGGKGGKMPQKAGV
jgi:ATP-binding cassette subfamily B protein